MSWFTDWIDNMSRGWNDFWNNGYVDYGDWGITNPWSQGVGLGPLAASSGAGPIAGQYGSLPEGLNADIPTQTTVSGDGGPQVIDTALQDALQGSVSVQDYFKSHPEASPEELLKFMAQEGNDEWTEKYIDYYLEKKGIEDANAYTASREDTAYQRLVQDLRAAGLNPAMMYGSTASTSSSGSISHASPAGGANSGSISNYSKLKKILLAYTLMQIKLATGMTNSIGDAFTAIVGML